MAQEIGPIHPAYVSKLLTRYNTVKHADQAYYAAAVVTNYFFRPTAFRSDSQIDRYMC